MKKKLNMTKDEVRKSFKKRNSGKRSCTRSEMARKLGISIRYLRMILNEKPEKTFKNTVKTEEINTAHQTLLDAQKNFDKLFKFHETTEDKMDKKSLEIDQNIKSLNTLFKNKLINKISYTNAIKKIKDNALLNTCSIYKLSGTCEKEMFAVQTPKLKVSKKIYRVHIPNKEIACRVGNMINKIIRGEDL